MPRHENARHDCQHALATFVLRLGKRRSWGNRVYLNKRLACGRYPCYALSRKPRFKLARRWKIAVKAVAVPLALVFVTVTWAQSNTPQPKQQVSKSKSTSRTEKQLSP